MDTDSVAAAITARDKAMTTPEEVRKAFLAQRFNSGGLSFEPWSIATMWLLDEIKSPLLNVGQQTLTPRDVARAIFVFSDTEAAANLISQGVAALDAQAFNLVRGLPMSALQDAINLIQKIIGEGLATVPGAGGSNPPETGS